VPPLSRRRKGHGRRSRNALNWFPAFQIAHRAAEPARALLGHREEKEDRIAELYARLGVRPGAPIPWFEVLVRSSLLGNIGHRTEIIAHRLK
jgi:hypothetical protein